MLCLFLLGNAPVTDVLVHRSQVLKDLIEEFKALDIPNYRAHLNLVIINERGEIEEGRGLGVSARSNHNVLAPIFYVLVNRCNRKSVISEA